MFLLKAKNLTKRFGEQKKALDTLNLEVQTSRLCFLGQNGSGKTTVLSIIAGILTPSTGSLDINGIEPYKNRAEALKSSTFLFEKPKLSYRMKVKEFIDFARHSPDFGPDFEHMLKQLDLEEFYDERLFKLSSGQEQLITLLSAFSRNTSRIIADEAFTHIDIYRTGNVINDMYRMNRDLIFSTHVPEEAETLADYIVILNNGRAVWNGTINDLFSSDIFEVYITRGEQIKIECLFRYGGICLVKSDTKKLAKLLESGVIIGFRKSGVRRIYGQFDNDR